MSGDETNKQHLKSLKRGVRAMALINQAGSVTIAQLARALGLPRTTTERILLTLQSEGLLDREPVSKAFTLTAQVELLSSGYSSDLRMVKVARPLMQELTREIGWPVCLATPLGEHMSIRLTTDHETTLNLNRRHIGSSGPIALVSSGLAFLAYLDDVQREAMLAYLRGSDDPAQALVHDQARLDFVLDSIRKQGFAFGLDYGRERSVAVPILAHGQVKGAIFMAFMARVLAHEDVVKRYVGPLQRLAQAIESQAFGSPEEDALPA